MLSVSEVLPSLRQMVADVADRRFESLADYMRGIDNASSASELQAAIDGDQEYLGVRFGALSEACERELGHYRISDDVLAVDVPLPDADGVPTDAWLHAVFSKEESGELVSRLEDIRVD